MAQPRASMVGMKTTTQTIETVIETRYAANAMTCDPIVVDWAASHLATLTSAEHAGREWKRINRKIEKTGRPTSWPRYEHPLFAAYFAKKAA